MYVKLVRDRVPARIRATGATVNWHIAQRAELHEKFGFKLDEEITEFANAKNPEELIDVMEVVLGLGTFHGYGIPSSEVVAEWIGELPKGDDPLLSSILTLNDAANEFIVTRAEREYHGLVIELEKVILVTGFDRNTLEAMRKHKLETHGGFEFGTILDSVAEAA